MSLAKRLSPIQEIVLRGLFFLCQVPVANFMNELIDVIGFRRIAVPWDIPEGGCVNTCRFRQRI